jgi:hypothetical protein
VTAAGRSWAAAIAAMRTIEIKKALSMVGSLVDATAPSYPSRTPPSRPEAARLGSFPDMAHNP